MDSVIGKIVEIFNMEKVELVRLNGLVKYLNNNIGPINVEGAKTIINKLNQAGIIDYEYEITCPACKETSYIIIEKSKGFKTCDTQTQHLNHFEYPNHNKKHLLRIQAIYSSMNNDHAFLNCNRVLPQMVLINPPFLNKSTLILPYILQIDSLIVSISAFQLPPYYKQESFPF